MSRATHHSYVRFGKFILVGIVNTLIDLTIFYFLYNTFEVYFVLAHIFAFLLAATNSFLMNAIWTFGDLNTDQILKQLVSFLGVVTTGLALSTLVIYLLEPYAHIYVCKILATVCTLFWNYYGAKMLVFKRSGSKQ